MFKSLLVGGGALFIGMLTVAVVDAPVEAQILSQPQSSDPVARKILKASPVMPLPNQKYALCAGAITFNFDNVTYARCALLDGDSVSAKQAYKGGNVKTVNEVGNKNGAYVVSTFSPPSPSEIAAYSCKKEGAYAQCDGGICFESTVGKSFPGLGTLSDKQIVCSCPIQTSNNYHVWGPASCPTSATQYDAICAKGSDRQTSKNGVSLRVGNNGPVDVSKALVDYYDLVFKTSNGLKTCSRP